MWRRDYLKAFKADEGVLFIGKAQEKAPVFRTERRRNAKTGATYPWLVRSTAMVNQFYVYAVDRDFGPFFLKFCSYFPYNAKLCINGHEWLKRQLAICARSATRRWITASCPARIRSGRRRCASGCRRRRSMPCCASGCAGCRIRLAQPTGWPAIATTSRSCKRSSRSPRCWTGQ